MSAIGLLKSINVEDQRVFDNLNKILHREKNQQFKEKNGRLKPLTGLKARFLFWWNSGHLKVQKLVHEALQNLNHSLQNAPIDQSMKKFLRLSLSSKGNIGRLSKCIFNRSILNKDSPLSLQCLPEQTIRLKFSEEKYHDLTLKQSIIDAEFPLLWKVNDLLCSEQDNFLRLITDQPGTKYKVCNGKLTPLTGLKDRISYYWDRIGHEQKIREAVHRVVLEISNNVKRFSALQAEVIVREFFFDRLAKLNKIVFDRSWIKESSEIEKMLMPELDQKRGLFFDCLNEIIFWELDLDVSTRNDFLKSIGIDPVLMEKAWIDYAFREILFGKYLGIELQKIGTGGTGAPRLAFDRYGNPLFVIKACDEGGNGPNNPSWLSSLKRFFIFPRPCLWGNSEPHAEEASSLLDRHLKIYSVPPTTCAFVSSSSFKGRDSKWCSAQMYVDNAVHLGKYLKIPSWFHFLPRTFIRYYLSKFRKREIDSLLPKKIIEKIAIHNFLGEDTDTHFENILVKKWKVKPEGFKFGCIDELRGRFFKDGFHQRLLDLWLDSENMQADSQGNDRIALIKHDGGASQPHSHPKVWLGTRFKHFFEVLPFFGETPFSTLGRRLVLKGERNFFRFLYEKALKEIVEISSPDLLSIFLKNQASETLLQNWIFCHEKKRKERLLKKLVLSFAILAGDGKESEKAKNEIYFTKNFERLKDNLATRIDCWRILKHWMKTNPNSHMRDLLKNIRGENAFKRKLNEIGEDERFFKRLENAPRKVQKPKWLLYG